MSDKILYHKILPAGQFAVHSARPELELARSKQTHSTGIAEYNGESLEDVEVDGILFKYDTLKANKAAVAVTTADCMPVLFLGKDSGVFLHAGWRGLAGGILTNPLIKTCDPFYAFIGPSIELESFEVQKDFRQFFPQEEFFHEIGSKTFFDLHAKAAHDIYLAYPGIRLEMSGRCTYKFPKFHSWRRDRTKERNWNIFSL